ncbi:5'-methylthioadenosine/adenosylhomocysteine nucleosidase [Anaerolentibacter hominis]|uniref:5'-methylthioadenosine/adenosylhomocysteine nucleosidase n=1 Tax=Anaerolentibacter hominis TaxID=3079009 RepID=UPI0031B7FE94
MKKIGIIGAMEEEVEQLIAEMNDKQLVRKASMNFYTGKLCGCDAVVVRCGIGKVNAALCVQILADIFEADCVINTGIAGGLDARIKIGDVVVSTEALEHDMDAGGFGYEAGVIPQMDVSVFQADEPLRDLAVRVCREVNPDIQVLPGRILTGDQFVCSREKKEWLTKTFHGACVEMEGAAIAHAAYLNQIPFVILRGISDQADDGAEMDYDTFEKLAILHSVRLVKGMLEQLM